MSPLNAVVLDRPHQPILTITTLKNWVLPPRPKNARKAKCPDKKKKKLLEPIGPVSRLLAHLSKSPASSTPTTTPSSTTPGPAAPLRALLQPLHQLPPKSAAIHSSTTPHTPTVDDLHSSIRVIDRENYQLKTELLSLIHDYKSLRALVLHSATSVDSPTPALYDSATTARKRLYTELGDHGADSMTELILNMNELSYKSPHPELELVADPEPLAFENELFDFVNLDSDLETPDDIDDDLLDSQLLSRLISPSASETDEHLLMTSLTRSTTVSTNNSTFDKKPVLFMKFYDLPTYSEDDYAFTFEKIDPHDKMMAVIEEDHYNQVADFLEEKLMSNDVKYYVEKNTPC